MWPSDVMRSSLMMTGFRGERDPLDDEDDEHGRSPPTQATKLRSLFRCESTVVGALLLVCGIGGAYILAKEPRKALSFGLSSPPPFDFKKHPQQPSAKWGKKLPREALPTNAWWTNLVLEGNSAPSQVTPYAVRARFGSLEVSYGAKRLVVTELTVVEAFAPDIALGAAADKQQEDVVEVVAADALTLSLRVATGAIAHLARGSPYLTVEFDKRVVRLTMPVTGFASVVADDDDGKGAEVTPAPAPVEKAECSAHKGCAGLAGMCCPTAKGVSLGCCDSPLQNEHMANARGTRFTVTATDGSVWRVYASEVIELTQHTGVKGAAAELWSTADFSGIVRVAYVAPKKYADDDDDDDEAQSATVALLDKHYGRYAIGGDVRWTSVGHEATYRFAWQSKSFIKDHELLGLCLPHHAATMMMKKKHKKKKKHSEEAAVIIIVLSSWWSLKGQLGVVVGEEWRMTEPLTKITWEAPRRTRSEVVSDEELVRAIQKDAADLEMTTPAFEAAYAKSIGVYTAGKRAAKFASLALAAKAMGSEQSAKQAARAAARAVEPWLAHNGLLVYDSSYGGVVTRAGLIDENADFGNGWYNDHHFHYGYLIYAASVALKILGSLSDLTSQGLGALSADIANVAGRADDDNVGRAPRSTFFPVARHKDFYDGHSWASGLFEMNDGKSQESVSEAANAYYAVSLLGEATSDYELRDWGRLLLATEARCARTYWEASNYPAPFDNPNNARVGVIGALDVSARTWFGSSEAYAVLINFLPVTPASELLLGPNHAVMNAVRAAAADMPNSPQHKDTTLISLDPLPGDPADPESGPWRSLLLGLLAVVDPKSAAEQTLKLTNDAVLDLTLTRASMLYWVATRQQPSNGSLTQPPTPVVQQIDDDDDDDAAAKAAAATASSKTSPNACEAHPVCFKLGLKEGLCCPTTAGVRLSCCSSS